jgi:chitinase
MKKGVIIIVWILLFFSQLQLLANEDYLIIGYYTSWMESTYPAEAVQYDHLTHIHHAFAWPDANGFLCYDNDFFYSDLIDRAHQEGVKVSIALGGWGQSDGFGPMTADSSKRSNFINYLIDFCQDHGYDGVDIDWEYPTSTEETQNLNLFIYELFQENKNLADTLLITMAIPASDWYGRWFDFDFLQQYVDWFGCMTYDFFGSWVNRAGHNAPLYPPLTNDNGSVFSGLIYLNATRSISKDQILIGIPFYGRGCNATGYNQPNTGENVEYTYSEVDSLLQTNWHTYWDDTAKVPYLLNESSTKFVTYDDTQSVRLKCEFVKEKNLPGVMIWALGQDMIGSKQPLLDVVQQEIGKLPQTAIHPYQQPRSHLIINNYPNPFNVSTIIRFYLDRPQIINLSLANVSGQTVTVLIKQQRKEPGIHEILFYANNLSSGIYLTQLKTDLYTKTHRMVLFK